MSENIKPIDCESIDDFLEILNPTNLENKNCFFRGQCDEEDELLPRIWRHEKDNEIKKLFLNSKKDIHYETFKAEFLERFKNDLFSADLATDRVINWWFHYRHEHALLAKFYTLSNAIGLQVHQDYFQNSALYIESNWIETTDEVNRSKIFQMYSIFKNEKKYSPYHNLIDPALPQHYGVPTRALDWTFHPWNAAFFAAYSLLKNSKSKDKIKKIAVYSIKCIKNKENLFSSPIKILDLHNRHTNPFLNAQDGLFTITKGDVHYLRDGFWPSIDQIYKEHGNTFFELRKFTLPTSLAGELLNKLSPYISIAKLMPHYTKVAEQIIFEKLK